MSALTVLPDITSADKTTTDPGSGGAIPLITSHKQVELVSAATESRTLAAPPMAGFEITLVMKTDGGDITITSAVEVNLSGHTSIVFNDAGDIVRLVGINKGGTLVWRTLLNAGASIS